MKNNRDNHNVLMIILESGDKITYSFPFTTTREEAIKRCLELKEFDDSLVAKVIWINDTEEGLAAFGDYFDPENEELDLRPHAIEQKTQQLRSSRLRILQKLDIEMIKLLEQEDCLPCKKRLSKIKKYLRDLPDLLEKQEFKRLKDINNFNPYDNVFDIFVDNPGSGYTSPPTIEIEPPNGHPLRKGFQMKAEAVIEDGSITEVKITHVGSSYVSRPKVTVSAPNEEEGEQALLIADLPQNNINLV